MSRAVPKRAPTHEPPRKPRSRGLALLPSGAMFVLGVAATLLATRAGTGGTGLPQSTTAAPAYPTVGQMMGMNDADLAAVDPLVMNLVVAKGIPECAGLDIAKYAAVVDQWAKTIQERNSLDETSGRVNDLYREDRKLWLAGGMAVMLARDYGVKYTTAHLDSTKPEQSFVHGVVDTKMGTCSSMPILYTAIGHRLGWPIKEVVSLDHCWARWDDGIPPEKGGQRFNLEATTVNVPGHEGQLCIDTDEDYAKELKTPKIAIAFGSDMTSLTPREVLGVHLQARAAYWAAHEDWKSAELDLFLANACFPKNRQIRFFLFQAMACNNAERFTDREIEGIAAVMFDRGVQPKTGVKVRTPSRPADVDAINRDNMRRMQESMAPPPTMLTPTPGTNPP